MQIDDQVFDAVLTQIINRVRDERAIEKWDRRFGAPNRERPEPGAEPRS